MRIRIDQIRPNPFRDFNLYPYDPVQIERLAQSIGDLGFFTGVTVRPNGKGYEMAAGHHRMEAARLAKLTEVEAVIDDYSDAQMVAIMTNENLLQRGHNSASVLDSVAAYVRLVSRDVLLGGTPAKNIAGGQWAHIQEEIAESGPGERLLYEAMNGFAYSEKGGENKAAISLSSIRDAIDRLRKGGYMAKILKEVLAEVEWIRKERDEEAERKTRQKQEAEERAAYNRQKDRENKLKVAREAEQKAIARAAKDKADAAAKAEADRLRIERERQERENREAAAKEAKEKAEGEAKQKAEAKAEEDRRAKERKAIEQQQKEAAVYDLRVSQLFSTPSHETAFKQAVLGESGRRFIPRDKQFEFAQHLLSKIEPKNLSASAISMAISAHLSDAISAQREIDDRERQRQMQADAERRVEEHWKDLRRAVQRAEEALAALVEDERSWPYDKAAFPIDLAAIDTIADISRNIANLKKKLV